VSSRIDQYINIAINQPESNKEGLSAYAKMMHGSLDNLSKEDKNTWAAKQAYIALGFALAACAELHIDSCAMEGFKPDKFNQILNLPDNQNSVVALAIGYRKDLPHKPKIRFSLDELITKI
jgi:nitroreductase